MKEIKEMKGIKGIKKNGKAQKNILSIFGFALPYPSLYPYAQHITINSFNFLIPLIYETHAVRLYWHSGVGRTQAWDALRRGTHSGVGRTQAWDALRRGTHSGVPLHTSQFPYYTYRHERTCNPTTQRP
jgi:hypothetical protein